MKKTNVMCSMLLLICTILLVGFAPKPLQLDENKIVKMKNEQVNEYLINQNLFGNAFLNEQKNFIYDHQLQYLSSAVPSQYIIPQAPLLDIGGPASEPKNGLLYSMNWSSFHIFDFNKEPTMHAMAYLFINKEGIYYMMLNYDYTMPVGNQTYCEMRFSQRYDMKLVKRACFVLLNNQEYAVNPAGYHYGKNMFHMPYYEEGERNRKMKVKSYITVQFTLKDVTLKNDFISITTNIFEKKGKTNGKEFTLGVNSFSFKQKELSYIPFALELLYEGA